MDLLKSKTVTATSGLASVNIGVSSAQTLGVFRYGEQKDKTTLISVSDLDGSNWTFVTPTRISFGTSFPFIGAEKIRIIYKVTI